LKQVVIAIILLFIAATSSAVELESYIIERLSGNLYAAIAKPGSTATSNAFFYIGRRQVVAGGAHMTERATRDLLAAIKERTSRPLRYFILPHHHPGYTSVDFYLPAATDVIMTLPVWQSIKNEVAQFPNQIILYSDGLTFKVDDRSIILTNMGQAHAGGDTMVYIPEDKTLFTSDMLYVNNVGFMGEGHMEEWVLGLEFMQQLDVETVIPGSGPMSKPEVIGEFKDYFKAFLSEVIKHIEAGDSLDKTRKEFALPRYRNYIGYDQLLGLNVERAYRNLSETVLSR